MLAESWVAPMPTNVRHGVTVLRADAAPALMGDDGSARSTSTSKRRTGKFVLIEFPFGEPAYEILATFYAGYHRKPLVNGYSGFFPEGYLRRVDVPAVHPVRPRRGDEGALDRPARRTRSCTKRAFPDGRGHEITDWLVSTGATIDR